MDEKTLKVLIKEAEKHQKRATKEFEKYDNHDDMHDMEVWTATVVWLKSKLASSV
jgi:hypothetical protein